MPRVPRKRIIAVFCEKKKKWDYQKRRGFVFWLPVVRTVSKRQFNKLKSNPENVREFRNLERIRNSRRAAGSIAVTSSDFKFVDETFFVKEKKGKDHKVAFVQIIDFDRRVIGIHWHDMRTPHAAAMASPARSPSPASSSGRGPSRSPSPLNDVRVPTPTLPRQGPLVLPDDNNQNPTAQEEQDEEEVLEEVMVAPREVKGCFKYSPDPVVGEDDEFVF